MVFLPGISLRDKIELRYWGVSMADDQETLSIFASFLPPDLLSRLRLSSEQTGCPPADLLRNALRRFLAPTSSHNAVYLSAPINALVAGLYVENTTIGHIKQHGDFGLGTFNFLDGEMVVLDGCVYQIRSDGHVCQVADNEQSPFACVTFFKPDTIEELNSSDGAKSRFYDVLDNLIPSRNMLYAIRVDGTFNHVKTRVVPRSDNYRPLVEATKNQPVFDFDNVRGCLAGFYTPGFMESLNAPGYHMHFLTEDRQHGGHLIECALGSVRIGIQHVPKLDVGLPITLDYLTADLTRDVGADLNKAEH
jgi:acetolactate decarboxylase